MHYAAKLRYIKLQILIQYLVLANPLNVAAGSAVIIDL
jgi:hypothetical protein